MFNRSLLMLTLLLVSAGMISACNGDTTTDTGDGAVTDGDMAGTSDVTVMTLDAFAFEPATLSAAAGQEVNLTLDNTGQALEHTWVLLTQDETPETALTVLDVGEDERKLFEMRVQPGETASSTFTAPETSGAYVVVCAVAGHAVGGMVGTLNITP